VRQHLRNVSTILKKKETKLALIVALLLSLIPVDVGRYDGIVGAIADAGHFWFYLTVFLFLSPLVKDRQKLLFSLSAVSGVIELVQPLTGRDGNIQDFLVSSLGALCGYICRLDIHRLVKLTIVLICAIPLFFPIYHRVEALEYQERNAPELARFETSHWRHLWKATAPGVGASSRLVLKDNGELQVISKPGKEYPGLVYQNQQLPWGNYKNLEIGIRLPKDQTISIRIDDNEDCEEFKDRFNKMLDLKAGDNLIQLPIEEIKKTLGGRTLNVYRVKRLAIFSTKREVAEEVFTLTALRLK